MKLKKEVFYYIFFSCFTLYWGLDVTLINSGIDYSLLSKLSFCIGFSSFCIYWFKTKFTKIEIIKQIIFLAIILFVFIASGMHNSGLLIIFPAIVGLKGLDTKKVVKTMFWTLSISFALFLILCVLGIIPTSTYTKIDAFGNSYNMIRFGQQHGNTIYIIWFNILCSYIYSHYDTIKKWHYLILLLLSIFFYLVLSCRTGILLSIIIIMISYCIQYKNISIPEKLKNILNKLIDNSYLLFYLVIFFIAAFLSKTWIYEILNKLVTSRIAEVRYYLVDIGFGLLPQNVIYYWICDNTQIKILVSYGLIFTLLYLFFSIKTIKYLRKNNMNIEIAMMIVYLLYSYCEVAFFKPVSDFSMLFFSYVLFNSYYIDDGEVDKKMKKIKNSIKTGNLLEKIFCYILIFLGFSNERIQVMEVRCKINNYLKKRHFNKIDLSMYEDNISSKKSDYIWFCWLQGYEAMPDIVSKCYERVKKFHSDKKIIFIDSNSYSNYINIPNYIVDKWNKGLISHAHFSDIIRTSLLAEFGGTWIDSTTYLTSAIPDYVFDGRMFMFDMSNEDDMMIYNNWFIYTKKNNRVFIALRDYLYLFWKKENKVREYFIWHLFMRHIYNYYKKDFETIVYIPHECSHMLIRKLNDKYDEKYYKLTDSICPIQKLTYKNIDKKKTNSFYYQLISRDVK